MLQLRGIQSGERGIDLATSGTAKHADAQVCDSPGDVYRLAACTDYALEEHVGALTRGRAT
jgi:hypothetical protein